MTGSPQLSPALARTRSGDPYKPSALRSYEGTERQGRGMLAPSPDVASSSSRPAAT